ncbi:MAG: hypothetical protein Q4A35_03065 [Candidatus Gracilibacteria bacterium]|nr:hypothetical protein [Candidatus Gracilibacteria bacterium]
MNSNKKYGYIYIPEPRRKIKPLKYMMQKEGKTAIMDFCKKMDESYNNLIQTFYRNKSRESIVNRIISKANTYFGWNLKATDFEEIEK